MIAASSPAAAMVTLLAGPDQTGFAARLELQEGRRARLTSPVPLEAGALVQIEHGSSILLAEVVACERGERHCTLHARIEHRFTRPAQNGWAASRDDRRNDIAQEQQEIRDASPMIDVALARTPSLFGQLFAIAVLRYFGLDSATEAVKRAVSERHQELFSRWLCLTLEQQQVELDTYFSGLEGHRRMIIETWLRLAPYRWIAPTEAGVAERALWLADFDALADVLKSKHSCPATVPEVSARAIATRS